MEEGPSQSGRRGWKSIFRRFLNSKSQRFEDEVQELIDHGEERGVITSGEGEMIQNLFELGDTVAREVMVPRISMQTLPVDTPLSQVLDLAIQSGHSRLPVFEGHIDQVIGILHVKDLLSLWGTDPETILPRSVIRPSIFVPETKKIVDLLAELRTQKSHMAVVIDEYGGTAGLITLEDIIEEIVGEINDEYDVVEEPIKELDDGAILVDARLSIAELEEYLSLEFPEGDYESVGGFITESTGRVPQEGESIEFHDLVLTVRSADERKISQVEVRHKSSLPGLEAETA